MTDKKIMIDLDDEKASKIAEVLASKVCKAILNVLAEENLSESDIAEKLKLPLNTIEYNLKKLIHVGLVEKSKDFFWSRKGKRVPVYKTAKKTIIISPKMGNTLKSVLVAGIVSGITALGINIYSKLNYANVAQVQDYALKAGESAISEIPRTAIDIGNQTIPLISNNWTWFLGGALFALLIILILNWRKL